MNTADIRAVLETLPDAQQPIAEGIRAAQYNPKDDPVLCALQDQGMVLGPAPHEKLAVTITCPNAAEHTTGDTVATYYPPHTGGNPRWAIHCFHSHCADLKQADWREKLALPLPRPLLKPVDWAEVNFDPPEFLIGVWLAARYVTLLGGHGGTGKTFLALVLAAHFICGEMIAGLAVEKGPVLFVTFEDEPSLVHWRLWAVIDAYNLDPEKVLGNFKLIDGTEQFAPLMGLEGVGGYAKPGFTAAYEDLRRLAQGHPLIIIDNASDAFDANENDRRHVRQFIQGLTRLARECKAAVLLLAHIDKLAARGGAANDNYSGSTAWNNSCRSRLALVWDKEVDGLVLKHEKNNLGPLEKDLLVDIGHNGVPFLTGPDETFEVDDRGDLNRCFEAAAAAGLNVPAKVTPGNGSAMQALETLECYPSRFKSKAGRQRVSQVLNSMQTDGVLVVKEYRDGHRNTRRRFELRTNAGGAERCKLERV
jgi:hypothetical protein